MKKQRFHRAENVRIDSGYWFPNRVSGLTHDEKIMVLFGTATVYVKTLKRAHGITGTFFRVIVSLGSDNRFFVRVPDVETTAAIERLES